MVCSCFCSLLKAAFDVKKPPDPKDTGGQTGIFLCFYYTIWKKNVNDISKNIQPFFRVLFYSPRLFFD